MGIQSVSGGCYKPLDPGQVQTVHQAGLSLLEDVGVGYEPGLSEAMDVMAQAGARLDTEKRKVYLPRELVERSLAKAPSQVILYSRSGDYDLDLSQHAVHLGTGGAAIKILDLKTGEARSTTLGDLYNLGRL
ncbi:MAG: trimethylamine methyltransferase family protein, partial [Desulfovermiculus sp.]